MAHKIVVMLDGGHLRKNAKKAGKLYTPDYIEKVGAACSVGAEEILRILYYDCAPYTGSARLPVSGATQPFTGSDAWLHQLAKKDLFAVRRGTLKFRGFSLDPPKIPYTPSAALLDSDFIPQFEQKGVDMRIGLDMAIIASNRTVDLIALATNDTDCIPAMKHVRRSGLQVALVVFPGYSPAPELLEHADFKRAVAWPV
jgi:uncharacterized LabA/DUF88 family protein